MLNFETGAEKQIDAAEGQKLKIIGFVDDDLSYGIANSSDIITDKNGTTTVAMNKVSIVDFDGKELKSYSSDGYYISNADISENMINLHRIRKSEDGVSYVAVSDYQIFGNEEEDTSVVTADVISTELKKKEMVITFVKKVTSSSSLEEKFPKEIQFSETNSLSIRELISEVVN